jgi:hypothetical protein
MKELLNKCKLISSKQYLDLVNPEFVGQTSMSDDCSYYMVWKSQGVLYKTHNKL